MSKRPAGTEGTEGTEGTGTTGTKGTEGTKKSRSLNAAIEASQIMYPPLGPGGLGPGGHVPPSQRRDAGSSGKTAACPVESLPPDIIGLSVDQAPDFSAFQKLLTSIRSSRNSPLGTVISQSMEQFLPLCDMNTLMCILSGMMGWPIPEGVQFDTLGLAERKPVYGLLCASINRLTVPNLISLMHSLIMTNHFDDSYLRVCAALLEKGVGVTFAWQSGLSQLVILTADVAALAVNGIMAGLNGLTDPKMINEQITANLRAVVGLSPDVLQNITTALTDLAQYGNDMLTIGILYIIQRLFTVINGSPQAQAVLARAPQPQPGSNRVVDLVRDGGVGVYNSLIDLINVLLAKPGSITGVGTRPTPDTQARQFCLSLVTGVLLSTGNNQAYTTQDARQEALQKLNNTRHLLGVLFPEWASELQQGNIATAIKNGADLVESFKGQILLYVDDPTTFPLGAPTEDDVLACFPMLSVSLTPQALRRHVAGDPVNRLLGLNDDTISLAGTVHTTASSIVRRGESYLKFLRQSLLDNPGMWLSPAARVGLAQSAASDNLVGQAATAVNNLFEGLVTGVQRGARLLCCPLELVRAPVGAMLEAPRQSGDFSVPTQEHPFIPESMIYISRFASEHAMFIKKYNEEGGDSLDADGITRILNEVFNNNQNRKGAYLAALKLAAVWGPTHNKVRYVMLPTNTGEVRPFIVLEGGVIGKVARLPLTIEGFGDVLPVETEHMIVSTIGHIREKVLSGVGSGFVMAGSLCSYGFGKIRTFFRAQPVSVGSFMSDEEQQEQEQEQEQQERQQNDVDLAVVMGMNPDMQLAVARADSVAITADTNHSPDLGSQDLGSQGLEPQSSATDGTPSSNMASEGGTRRRRAATAKRTRRKAYNKKSNKRKSSKQLLSRKRQSRRRQIRRK